MPCSPNDNNLNPYVSPGIPIPGFGIPFAPVQLPIPDWKFPDGFPADILDLLNKLKTLWPGGELVPNLDSYANNILTALASLFNMIAPFLSLYNFFMALLNMVACILDVIFCMPNTFKVLRAIRRLIKQCLPPFLALFPWAALLAMILGLLLLLLALIQYIIAKILQLIEDLLKNLDLLGKGVTLQDAESTAAVAIKIASLLCIIEGLMALFTAIGAIMSIIATLAQMGGRKVGCKKNNGDVDVCNDFIAASSNGITGQSGRLIYYRQINANDGNTFTRQESWQFVDMSESQSIQFKDIITPDEDGIVMWPPNTTYQSSSDIKSVPYLVNLTVNNFDPKLYHSSDTKGPRTFKIKNVIVYRIPYVGIYNEDNNIDNSYKDGTLSLLGGLVYEEDDTPYMVNGSQATIETFVHKQAFNTGIAPIYDDAMILNDITFDVQINYEVLLNYELISYGCVPDIAMELDIVNTANIAPILERVPDLLPDISGAQNYVAGIIADLRKNVSPENLISSRDKMILCLEDLRNQTTNAFCSTFESAVDPFTSEASLDTDMQFITRNIKVEVILKDPNGLNISSNIPDECKDGLSNLLRGNVTLGNVSSFKYENGQFVAYISSKNAGDGVLQVYWNNNVFSRIYNRDNLDDPTFVSEVALPYTFIGSPVYDIEPRRDESDASVGE